jgi:hypothetical protein
MADGSADGREGEPPAARREVELDQEQVARAVKKVLLEIPAFRDCAAGGRSTGGRNSGDAASGHQPGQFVSCQLPARATHWGAAGEVSADMKVR